MLGNEVPLWETMLAAIKIGAVVIPAATLLAGSDLEDRVTRGNASMAVTNQTGVASFADLDQTLVGGVTKIAVGGAPEGWVDYADAATQPSEFTPAATTSPTDPLLEYFTSGTTAKPKLVQHTQSSYPVGHLSTMYWLGLQKGDVHWTISSPGWAKHAWSCFFAPFNAQACIFMYNYTRFDGPAVLKVLVDNGVNTLCAPPTVWRFLIESNCWTRTATRRPRGRSVSPSVTIGHLV